jgi:hypothetical protein
MKMNNKTLFLISAFALIMIIGISSVSAYDYIYGNDLYPVYKYYDDSAKYNNIPIVTGPFPRAYLWNRDAENGKNVDFLFDDFHHYDDFIGYKDLDVFDPSTGTVEVIRSETSTPLDLSQIPSGMQTFGDHVYGYLPGCLLYRKHYNHEHPWDLEVQEYDYGYGYDYGYYTPFLAYRNKPVSCPSCQQRSICQLTHSCA